MGGSAATLPGGRPPSPAVRSVLWSPAFNPEFRWGVTRNYLNVGHPRPGWPASPRARTGRTGGGSSPPHPNLQKSRPGTGGGERAGPRARPRPEGTRGAPTENPTTTEKGRVGPRPPKGGHPRPPATPPLPQRLRYSSRLTSNTLRGPATTARLLARPGKPAALPGGPTWFPPGPIWQGPPLYMCG